VGKKELAAVGRKTTEHEFYASTLKGYKPGKTKYVVITGSVISGLGKGVFSAVLAKLLQDRGLRVSPMKFDGYLNVDAGTLNPYRHGEVFVLDDGTECDMDLGTYERFLDGRLSADNYITAGKLFSQILKREREGKYLGRDVMFVPHVTGFIKDFVRTLGVKTKADVVLVEVGGTVGDIENSYFIEAMRELSYEEGSGNVCYVNVTYILKPGTLGEQKSKAAQFGIRALMSQGIQPHIIACRASEPVAEKVREKVSIASNVPLERVVSFPDIDTIYAVPQLFKDSRLDSAVMEILGLKGKAPADGWNAFVRRIRRPKKTVRVGITGKYTGLHDSYASILHSLEHAGAANDCKVRVEWIETSEITVKNAASRLKGLDGIIVPGGFGSRGWEGKIACAKYAREHDVPYLGLCLGFQTAVIDVARHVCGLKAANSTEMQPNTAHPVIELLPQQLDIEGLGGNMRLGARTVEITKGSFACKLYGGATRTKERFRHRYECNPDYVKRLQEAGLAFSGCDTHHTVMQILEYPKNKFFVGSQFHPEFLSRPLRPHPLFNGFIAACVRK